MRDRIRVFSFLALCLVSLARSLAQAAPTQRDVIHVDVVGLRNNNGQVFCALYASAEGFPKDSRKATRRNTSSISDKIASCEFLGIEPERMQYRCSTMRIPTVSWIPISWGYRGRALELPTTREATWVHPNSMRPNSNFLEAGSTSRSR